MKSLMKLFIRKQMSVLLKFDIGDISQPFHQRCSVLATEGRSGILTKLLLKAVGHSRLLSLGDIPNLVFDVFLFENRPKVIILTCILQTFLRSGILFNAIAL